MQKTDTINIAYAALRIDQEYAQHMIEISGRKTIGCQCLLHVLRVGLQYGRQLLLIARGGKTPVVRGVSMAEIIGVQVHVLRRIVLGIEAEAYQLQRFRQ